MPKPGFSSITVSDKVKNELRKIADKNDESIPDTITRLLKNCKQEA